MSGQQKNMEIVEATDETCRKNQKQSTQMEDMSMVSTPRISGKEIVNFLSRQKSEQDDVVRGRQILGQVWRDLTALALWADKISQAANNMLTRGEQPDIYELRCCIDEWTEKFNGVCLECQAVPTPLHEYTSECWCEPSLDYVDPDTGVQVWVHRDVH